MTLGFEFIELNVYDNDNVLKMKNELSDAYEQFEDGLFSWFINKHHCVSCLLYNS